MYEYISLMYYTLGDTTTKRARASSDFVFRRFSLFSSIYPSGSSYIPSPLKPPLASTPRSLLPSVPLSVCLSVCSPAPATATAAVVVAAAAAPTAAAAATNCQLAVAPPPPPPPVPQRCLGRPVPATAVAVAVVDVDAWTAAYVPLVCLALYYIILIISSSRAHPTRLDLDDRITATPLSLAS